MADQVAGLLSPLLRAIRIHAVRHQLRGDVLDFGCSSGTLSCLVPCDRYWGVDIDSESIAMARRLHPSHRFMKINSAEAGFDLDFDTIVALAVLEHVQNPALLLKSFASWLREGGSVIVTTPHPSFGWVHRLGAAAALFSREAEREHIMLLDRKMMSVIVSRAGLEIAMHRRFLMGANQLFVLRKRIR